MPPMSDLEARVKNGRLVLDEPTDLPEGTDPHSDEAYQMARTNLDAFVEEGVLVQDDVPTFYFYGQNMPIPGGHMEPYVMPNPDKIEAAVRAVCA